MSDAAAAAGAPQSTPAVDLDRVPLFEGLPAGELAELAAVLHRVDHPAGTLLWREGEPSDGLLLVLDGLVRCTLGLPGGHESHVADVGAGEVLGELPLLDGGAHSATARVAEPASFLLLPRGEFGGLVSRRRPTAFALRRRFVVVVAGRLHHMLQALGESLGPVDEATLAVSVSEPSVHDLPEAPRPSAAYLLRLPFFRGFDRDALEEVLTLGRFALCPPGLALIPEGTRTTGAFVTVNGAVEELIVRRDRRVRVALAGPGRGLGYGGLLDGGLHPTTAATRERALLFVLPPSSFERLFGGETAGSHAFLDVIQRDVVAALRQGHRPHARLASRPAWEAGPRAPR